MRSEDRYSTPMSALVNKQWIYIRICEIDIDIGYISQFVILCRRIYELWKAVKTKGIQIWKGLIV
jgi:hypothetical protein